jgi:hypothetical protein
MVHSLALGAVMRFLTRHEKRPTDKVPGIQASAVTEVSNIWSRLEERTRLMGVHYFVHCTPTWKQGDPYGERFLGMALNEGDLAKYYKEDGSGDRYTGAYWFVYGKTMEEAAFHLYDALDNRPTIPSEVRPQNQTNCPPPREGGAKLP